MQKLFFELLRVAIGTQDSLSRLPSNKEWKALYDMAKKQSLVGVCFAALQRLGADADEGFARIGMSEMMYLTWMGMTAKIQQKNQTVDEQCVALQKRLSAMGYRSCILKGQANHANYGNDLAMLRQSGDIDIWVEGGRKTVVELVNSICPTKEIRETHAQLRVFEDTEVEVHYRPGLIRDFRRNKRLQAFFQQYAEKCFSNKVKLSCGEIVAPPVVFNAVQQLLHIYHHLFDGGIGLRQVMDYYFVLRPASVGSNVGVGPLEVQEIKKVINDLSVSRFASALMWVLRVVFGLEEIYMLWEPNEKDGQFLLSEIMQSGNFGQYDERNKRFDMGSYTQNFFGIIEKNLAYFRFAPWDWLMSPMWRVYHFIWRKKNGYE